MAINRRQRQIITKSLILVIAAGFCAWLLEYRARLNDASAAFEWIFNSPLVYLYSALIIFFILLLVYGIIRRPFAAVGIVTALILIIGYINIAKFNFRGAPLLPEDFQLSDQAGTLTKFVDIWEIVRLVVAVILTMTLAILLDYLTAKWLKRETRPVKNAWWKRYAIASRIAIIAVAIIGLLCATGFIRHHTGEREQEVAWLGTKFTAWSQVINYNDNGFLIGFLYNCNIADLAEPDGYSKNRMQEITARLTEKRIADKGRIDLSIVDANIIIVLNESFYDPSIIKEYYNYTGGDVTPNLHRLQEIYPHGTMYSTDYGGGTANIEYEILTGLTNYWFDSVPYTNLIPKKKTVPSIATLAKENGYQTVTVHPFNGGMYKRENVLPILGIDEFITEIEFTHRDKDGESEYINDRSAYNETLDVLKNKSEKTFVSLITMQNHAPYDPGEYGESKFVVSDTVNIGEKTTELSSGEQGAIESYLMSLNLSDRYLGEFIEKLDEFDEKTIVLFFGDHSPGIFTEIIESDVKDISDLVRKTPYLVYANFDYQKDISLPETTPNCLVNTMLNLFNYEKPLVGYLLDDVCKTTPVLSSIYFGETAPFVSTELSEYELLTYDLVAGRQWAIP